MEYTTLGSTGMEVSRICLGCLSFGSSNWRSWVLDEEESLEMIEKAIDLGINFFDTANAYSAGESERVLGTALEGRREESVVMTKLYYQMDDDPNSQGLSRKAIEQELNASLNRLGMDTVDILGTHRYDYDTPIETTLRALDDTIRRGKVRHIGGSSMWAHQFADALATSDHEDLARYELMQSHYNLVYREEEREMHPLCQKKDIAVTPWSPIARGFLTRPCEEIDATERGQMPDEELYEHPYREGGGDEINERVQQLAEDYGVSMAQISLAWMFHQDCVTAPVVGTTTPEHLEEAVEALDISLSESDQAYLEEPYSPVPVSGHE